MDGIAKRLVHVVLWGVPLALVAVALAYAYARFPANSSADVAAWVQAVGSITAIAGSIWAVRFQLKRQAHIEAEKADKLEQQRLTGFLALLYHATRVVNKMVEAIQQGRFVDAGTAVFMRVEVAGIRTRFTALDPRDFTDEPRLIDAYSVAVASAQILEAEFEAYSRALEFGYASVESLHIMCAAARSHLWMETKAVRRALLQRGYEIDGDERLEPSP